MSIENAHATAYRKPGLIRYTRTVIKWLWITTLIIAPPLVIGAVGMLTIPDRIMAAGNVLRLTGLETPLQLRLSFVAFIGILLVTIPTLRNLLRIIDSAMIGDPFVPENARRLRRIGWLLLAMNLLTETEGWITGVSLPPSTLGGLITVLLTFVLAQIFEKGSHMRSELQETV
jgi:hypothetical protein